LKANKELFSLYKAMSALIVKQQSLEDKFH